MRTVKTILISFLLTGLNANIWGQELIVFTAKNNNSPVIQNFNNSVLPQLDEIAKNTESNLKVIYLENGIPEEIKYLPAIFFINNNQKSIYKSAYGSTQRIKTFILQSKVFTSNYESFTKTNTFYANTNDFEQGLNLKITSLEGLKSIDKHLVTEQIVDGLKQKFNLFQFKNSQKYENWNKQFFLNIYPYQSDDHTFYLSYEVFSQNNCHKPVLNSSTNPIVAKTLKNGGQQLAQKIDSLWLSILEDTLQQDGIFIIREPRTSKSWIELGYNFTSAPSNNKEVNTQLPQGSFQLQKERLIIFTFAPPADAYSGIIPKFDGEFQFTNETLKGTFIAHLKSLDSGDGDLNNSIIDDQFKIDQYPTATIDFNTEVGKLNYNEPTSIPAKLHFLGKEEDVNLQVTFTSGDGNINFWVNCDFILNIASFESLEKPHFDAPINQEVHIHITFKAHNLID